MTTLADLTEEQQTTNELLERIEDKFDIFFRDTFNQRGEMLEEKRETNTSRSRLGLPNFGNMIGKPGPVTKGLLGGLGALAALGALKAYMDNMNSFNEKFKNTLDGVTETIDGISAGLAAAAAVLIGGPLASLLGQAAGKRLPVPGSRPKPTPGMDDDDKRKKVGRFDPGVAVSSASKSAVGKTVTYTNSKGQVNTAKVLGKLDNGNLQVERNGATFAINEKNNPKIYDDGTAKGSRFGAGAKAFGATGALSVVAGGIEAAMIAGDENMSDREKNVAYTGIAGSAAGGAAGAAAGAKLGLLAGPAAPIAVPALAIAGGILGSLAGRSGGEDLADELLDPEVAQAMPQQPAITTIDNSTTNNIASGGGNGTEDSRGATGSILDHWNSGVVRPMMFGQ